MDFEPSPKPAEHAGPGLRLLAEIADTVTIGWASMALFCALAVAHLFVPVTPALLVAFALLTVVVWIAYFTFLGCGGGETPGYRLAGLRVVDAQGQPLGFGRSLARAVAKLLTYSLCSAGPAVSLFLIYVTALRQALHDMAAGARVLCVHPPRYPALARCIGLGVLMPIVLFFAILRPYVIQAYYIPAASMVPALQVDDRIIVGKLYYRFHAPQRGDIVVFQAPPNADPEQKDFVKRIIGLPGDTIEARDGQVLLNGKPAPSAWFADPPVYHMAPVKVQPGRLFVLGDNVNNSNDSHVWGRLPEEQLEQSRVRGKVVAIILPWERAQALP